MAIYSDVTELLQLNYLKGGVPYAEIKQKFGYSRAQVCQSNSAFKFRTAEGDLYILGYDDIVRPTTEGLSFNLNRANATRSDVGVERDFMSPYSRFSRATAMVNGLDVTKLAFEIIDYIGRGTATLPSLAAATGQPENKVIQAITLFNIKRGNGKTLIRSYVPTGSRTYLYEVDAEACAPVIDEWTKITAEVNEDEPDSVIALENFCR